MGLGQLGNRDKVLMDKFKESVAQLKRPILRGVTSSETWVLNLFVASS